MSLKRRTQKKLSIQFSNRETSQEEDSANQQHKCLTPKSHIHTETNSEEESEAAIKKIIISYCKPVLPEFESSIKIIQSNIIAKTQFQETKKNQLKMKLIERLKIDNFSKVAAMFKDSNSTNKTSSTSHGNDVQIEENKLSDDSLVNLESGDEETRPGFN